MFQESEFLRACDELDNPDVEGWELFTDSNGVKIYRLYNKDTGLYSYKVYGELIGITPEICSKVFTDLEYRKTWDDYVKELRTIKENEISGIYWQVKFPFPLYNREYIFVHKGRELDVNDRHVYVFLNKVHNFSSVPPPSSSIIRVSEYSQSLAITSNGKGGSKAVMHYYDNPGGMIPTWLINWAAKTGVPKFLTTMQTACEGYEQYLAEKDKS